jgi:hypothetical protein
MARLVLLAIVAVLALPAVSLADSGGSGSSTSAPGAGGGRVTAVLERVSTRLDRRFQAFSSHCLVQSPPARCSAVAHRFVGRMDKLQGALTRLEEKIKTKCAEPNPPARCANAAQVTAAIDSLVARLEKDEAAIKAAFPNAA